MENKMIIFGADGTLLDNQVNGLMGGFKGLSENELNSVALDYVRETLRPETRECLRALKIRGFIIGAISSNPQFVLDVLTGILSLDFAEGNRLEFRGGKSTGKINRKVDRYVKAEILKGKMRKYATERKDVIVVGDSITDLSMAELAGTFIALHPEEDAVKSRADSIIKNFNTLLRKGIL
jgi:phosphoserine phosphatase